MYYNEVKYGKFHVRRNFARTRKSLALPNLIENQINSFNWFVTKGLQELLENMQITNLSQTLELYFGAITFDEPEHSILECKEREVSYTRALRCMVKFHNGETNEVKEDKIFLCNFPWMTPTGTFIINGAERVIVDQIIRSSNVLFSEEADKKTLQTNLIGQVIPTRGSWIEFEMGSKNILYARVDRSNKIYLPIFLKSIGFKDHEAMKALFGDNIEYFNQTLEKDTTKDNDEALKELYMKIKQGDEIPAEGVRSFLESHFMDSRRYDLMDVGRYKFNKKLDFIERALGHKLAKNYTVYETVDGVKTKKQLKKGTVIDEEIAKLLDENREVFRRTIDDLVFQLRSEMDVNDKVIVEEIQVLAKQKNEEEKIVNIIGSYHDEARNYLTLSDAIAATSYYLNLIENVGHFDDIDNLANRRMRLTGELLANQIRVGLNKLEKSVKDKMSTKDVREMTAQNLINSKPLESCVKEFFGSSQLSQFMAQTNPLDEITHKRRLTALGPGGITRDRASIEVRDVHPTHYGRICPIETPEGQNIGLISSLASYAKVNEFGFIQTPYYKVVNGIVTDQYVYMTADEEALHYIAEANAELNEDSSFKEARVYARHNQETNLYNKEIIDFMDVSPKQIVSVSAACIPFLEHDDATRTLMGSNMQRQSIPLIQPEAPFVGTGIEYATAHDSGVACICKEDGVVEYVDGSTIKVRENDGNLRVYQLNKFLRSNQGTCINQKPICEPGEIVHKDDILADGPSMDHGELALGRNVLIAFMTWEGYNYEDAVILNENLVKNDVYTSIHIEKYELQARDTKLGKEEITREIPNTSEEARKNLDPEGIVIPGSVVKEEDILVGKVTPKGEVGQTPYQHLLEAILGEKSKDVKDSSLRVPHGGGGIVQAVRHYNRITDKELAAGVNEVVRVYIVQKRKIRVGDKMSGRHGNKGVISNILPQEDMPFLSDGTPLDILLNPQGIPSRMNIGQVLEVHLGMACRKLGVLAATEVFDCCRDEDLNGMMAEAGMAPDGKQEVFDGRTGEKFDNRITVGVMYMIKLDHMVDDKMHARSVGPYVLVTQQPLGGKAQNGGQRFGEMEVWALEAYGAAYTLQEMLTVKSDDILGRNRVSRAISEGKEIPEPNLPESFRVFTRELRSLGIYVELIDKKTGENIVDKSLVDEDSDDFIKRNHF